MSGLMLDWMKILHILSFVAWMAGIFYLPRLFVYHTRLEPGSESYAMFCEMERKLLGYIMTPAMISTWIFGLGLAHIYFLNGAPPAWLVLKIIVVVGMTGFHHVAGAHAKRFANGAQSKSERFYRFFNEVPTLLLVAIVVLVILKPQIFGY